MSASASEQHHSSYNICIKQSRNRILAHLIIVMLLKASEPQNCRQQHYIYMAVDPS